MAEAHPVSVLNDRKVQPCETLLPGFKDIGAIVTFSSDALSYFEDAALLLIRITIPHHIQVESLPRKMALEKFVAVIG